MAAYYNEFEPYAAQWLRNLIAAGHIAPGDVDERSITDVSPDDLKSYTQCHFFAGIGGWSLAARLAGWPDDRPLWTGSCPCQPFSVAGKGEGKEDERHLWPVFFGLIDARHPPVVMGEQVAAAVGKDWLDGVHLDMEGIGYACRAAVVPACAVDAPHRRDRLWFVADADEPREGEGREQRGRQFSRSGGDPGACPGDVGNTFGPGLEGHARHGDDGNEPGWFDPQQIGPAPAAGGAVSDAGRFGRHGREIPAIGHNSFGPEAGREESADRAFLHRESRWSGSEWAIGADGKARRVEPGIRLLAHGVSARVGRLRAYGNAIVPQVAAEVIAAYMETTRP